MAKTALRVKAARKPKFAVRGLPQVRALPDLPAGDGPPRRAPRRHQVILVSLDRLDHRKTKNTNR